MFSPEASQHHSRPKKSLSQNFLTSFSVAKSIVELASLGEKETVVEIGPGRGILTHLLASQAKQLIAIEFDSRLIQPLREKFKDQPNVTIIHTDALSYPFEKLPHHSKVISNLPYHIATPLLFRLLKERERFSLLVLMFQRELARRMVATPGGKTYGALSLAVQYASEVQIRMRVSKKHFRPNPKVDSAVVTLTPYAAPPVPVKNEDLFLNLLRSIFQHRRKTIKNTLKESGFSEPVSSGALQKTGVNPLRRPETLSLQEFALLSDHLFFSVGKL